MSKIAVVTDSNSGISQSEAKDLGIFVIPMPFNINDDTFFEDIDLTQEQFYEMLSEGADIFTSQPSPESVIKLWEELLQEYDQVVHIPMSSALSSSCQTAMMLAGDYEDKVYVVNNQRISVTQRRSVLDAITLTEQGKSGAEIKEFLEETKSESSIYITLDTLKYLKKGGRITPAAAALGTLLKIKPVLQIQGGKLDAFSKARTMKQAKTTMMNAVKSDIENRFGGDAAKVHLQIAYTENLAMAEEFKIEVMREFQQVGEIYMAPLSLSVSCHIGPGALALACTKKVVEDEL
ncbi:MAG: DegV family protein [Lachnospiraceae bacterium]|nr:DegV family protein [Lachnospiraceae bacterium]